MESLQQKLWRSGQVLKSYAFQNDENGLIELKPKVAIVTAVLALLFFGWVSTWAGEATSSISQIQTIQWRLSRR